MLTFLFEQYGYYPKDFNGEEFYLGDWCFKLIKIDYSDEYIKKIGNYIDDVRKIFEGKGAFLIKTRFDKYVSIYDNDKYVLISVYRENLSIKDMNKFHCSLVEENNELNLKKLLNVWDERINFIENNAINSIRIDSVYYKNNIEQAMFCLGLGQNALQYLSETIEGYGEVLSNLTITHKRMKNLESFDFFNPFNFVIDHPIRDLIELYKCDFISFNELIDLLNYYKLDTKLASLFIARMMYPAEELDKLEINSTKKELSFSLKYNIEKELMKLKKVYLYMKNEYNIRPIDWLEN